MTTKKPNPWSAKAKKKDNPWTKKAKDNSRAKANPLVQMMKAKRENPHAAEIARLDKQLKDAGAVLEMAIEAEKVAFAKLDKFDSTPILSRQKATDRYREVKEAWEHAFAAVERANLALLGLSGRRRRLETNGKV